MSRADAVTVAYVHSHEVTYSWHESLIAMLGHDMASKGRLIEGGSLAVKCGTDGLVAARNWAVEQFLADDRADWLWWVDTDMGFAPDTVDQLFAAADRITRPIMGGLCFAQKDVEPDGMGGHRTCVVPMIYEWVNDAGQKGFRTVSQYPLDQVTRCAGTGSACILIHRSVFESIRDEYGPVWYDRAPNPSAPPSAGGPSSRLISEDLSFCLRAGTLDIPVHVHAGVKTTHFKPGWRSEQDYAQQVFMQMIAEDAPGAASPLQAAER